MNQNIQPHSLNKLWMGVVLGLLLPVLFFLVYYWARFSYLSFSDFISRLMEADHLVHVISLAVFPNLGTFMAFVRTNRFRSGRGVLLTTICLGVIVFIVKFI